MGLLIALGVLLLIGLIPLGVSVCYGESGVKAVVIAGPVRIHVYPTKKKDVPVEKEQKPSESDKQKHTEKAHKTSRNDSTKQKTDAEKGGNLTDFLPLVDVALDMLASLGAKLRVNILKLHLVLGGSDPCDVAVNYGRLQAVGAGLLAQLNRFLVIKKQDVQIGCDFLAEQSTVVARVDLTITIGRLLSLVCVYGLKALITYLKINKQRKGGAAV